MIELWSWPAPNGQPVHILLEETGLPYTILPFDPGEGSANHQFEISAQYRVPVIIDRQAGQEALKLSETGAILIYLAEKAGNFIPLGASDRYACLQWLMFQTNRLGPALRTDPAASDMQIQQLLAVLEKQLETDDYLAGTYSIADIATYPCIAEAPTQTIDLEAFPSIRRWAGKMAGRQAVERGMALMGGA